MRSNANDSGFFANGNVTKQFLKIPLNAAVSFVKTAT